VNIRAVIEQLIGFFDREKIGVALIGAFALKALGYVRATQDLDFLEAGRPGENLRGTVQALNPRTIDRIVPTCRVSIVALDRRGK